MKEMNNLQQESTLIMLEMISNLQAQTTLILAALVNKSIFSKEEGFEIENRTKELSHLIFESSLPNVGDSESQKVDQKINEMLKCIGAPK